MIKILIVEDDKNIATLIKDTLKLANYSADNCYNGKIAINQIEEKEYDIIILDIMLPELDGFEIMEKIKNRNIPVIFVSAKEDIESVIKGLKMGAQDYIRKPFEPMELLARIENILKRLDKQEKEYQYKDIKIDTSKRSVKKGEEEVALTLKEFQLLELLIKNINIALSREEILNRVWGISAEIETRTVDYHIQQLRKKLGLKEEIVTVNKIGYRLEK